jgi:hypothetical protein
VTDYFSELKDQLAQVTEEGVHNRRRPLARLPRPRVGVLAAVASILLTVAVAAVALTTGGAARPRSPAAHSQSGPKGDRLVAGRHAVGATRTPPGGTSYCVSSSTPTRTACSPPTPVSPSGGGFPIISPRPGFPERLIAQLYLHAPSLAKQPTGVGRIVEQGGAFGISIAGSGLPANTKRDIYAVWLTHGHRNHKLLGFVDPGVTGNGRLKTAGLLPKGALYYDELLLTEETQHTPTAPGAVVLEGSFHR